MRNGFRAFVTGCLIAGLASPAAADGAGSSAGLTLLQAASARPAALAESFTAVSNDIAALGYNPGSLATLETGQASILYEKGLFDDTYGQALIGMPTRLGGWGLRLGYYNGGDFELTDQNGTRTVNIQTDLMAALAVGLKWRGAAVGVTGKFLSSKLIESEQATAYAADLGVQVPVGPRFRAGFAVQNFGTQLKFIEEGDPLPRIVRAGLAYQWNPAGRPVALLADVPYYLNEEEWTPSIGIESHFGPLALRAGYRTGDTGELTLGTGFLFGQSTFDYSFGMAEDLDARHRVSLGYKFGGPSAGAIVRAPGAAPAAAAETAGARRAIYTLGGGSSDTTARKRTVYRVKRGDSLSKIARRFYGSPAEWGRIMSANAQLDGDPRRLKVGQYLFIPKKEKGR